MAGKTRRIKKGGSPCLFILEDVLASISKLVKNIQKISDKKEVEKKREIKQSFTMDIYIVFMSQINASCSDIKPKKYEEFLKKIGNLMTAFREKREQLDELGDVGIILNKIDDMIEHGTQLMERVNIEAVVQTAISSKKPKKSKKQSKKMENVNISPDSEGLTEPEEQIISADDIVLTTAESPPKTPPRSPPRSPPKDPVLPSTDVLPNNNMPHEAPQNDNNLETIELINLHVKPLFTWFRINYLLYYNVFNMSYRNLKLFKSKIFPNISFTNKITKIVKSDYENFKYYTYIYIICIGLLNYLFADITKNNQNPIMAGLKLVFKGGRAAQMILPVGTHFESDDTDVLIMSSNPYHNTYFLRNIAFEITNLFRFPDITNSSGGLENPNIIKIAYFGPSGTFPISDIDFKYPELSQFYQDIQTEQKTWNYMPLIYYHQSSKSFFDEKKYIHSIYTDPKYKSCECDIMPHTPECAKICGERQFYLNKFSKYMR